MTYLLFLLFFLFNRGRAQQTLFPAAIPLAVRSPYLSCWDQTTNGTALGTLWPTTSNGKQVSCLPFTGMAKNKIFISQILGWSVLVRIDGLTYSLLGDVSGASASLNGTANVTDTIITPTQTVVVTQAGPMQVNLTFLNPIEVRSLTQIPIISTDTSLSARKLGQTVNSVLIPGLIYEVAGRRSP
jgi:hypothetical protein